MTESAAEFAKRIIEHVAEACKDKSPGEIRESVEALQRQRDAKCIHGNRLIVCGCGRRRGT